MNTAFYRKRMIIIRQRNEVSIAIRRGDTTLTAQDMRIEIAGTRGYRLQSAAAREANQSIFILGAHDMDIAVEDRLTYNNILYRVVFIQPNRLAATIAEAVAVE
jgi:hypothetical protein